jgi:hyperosmotically inducible protein
MSGRISKALAVIAASAAFVLAVACSSDAGITAKVKTKLAADSTIKASDIKVETKNHIVTLTGNVDNEAARSQAVALARGTDGVSDVVENLTVTGQAASAETGGMAGSPGSQAGAPGQTDDASITAAVKSKLAADTTVGGLKIDVDTKEGVVSLSGPVKTQDQKDTAERIARETSGVKDVQDNLVISG